MTEGPRRCVIVGASLAGTRAAQALRDRGFDGALTMVGAEPHLPYDRPPLSKSHLADRADAPAPSLLSPEDVVDLQLDLRLGEAAISLDADRRCIRLEGGGEVPYDALIIATGCAARMPAGWDELDGVHALRTLDDCVALRRDLAGSPAVLIVGAGFIGCEVAATARSLGLDVTVIEPLPAPLARALDPDTAGVCLGLHTDAGVRFRCATSVEAIEGEGRVERVRLSDGDTIDADVVVVGIGVSPSVEWLSGSGVAVGNGVLCDSRCATAVPGVYAAGDIARWHHPVFDVQMRVEHWTNASEQGAFVARSILDGDAAGTFGPVPFVWSEQHGVRIEIAGLPQAEDHVHVVDGSLEERRFVALYERQGLLVGAVAFDSTRQLLRYRRLLASRPSWAEAQDFALSST
jgi:NADPH-dependent 2,4-dienoyl-CoA reductase/sulfur reductase-like enzyme